MSVSELDDARTVEFPLRGEWMAYHTPATRIPSHGTDQLGQRFAFDFVRIDDRKGWHFHPAGRVRSLLLGVPTRECYAWGATIHAALGGVVVQAQDGLPERAWIHPVRELALVLMTALMFNPSRGLYRVLGNNVIVQTDDVFAAYAHLTTGSVAVTVGQTVEPGDLIGRVGHTGNSTAPHLHFQLMDGSDPMAAKGVPCHFASYSVLRDGSWTPVKNGIPTNTDRIRSTPTPAGRRAAAPEALTSSPRSGLKGEYRNRERRENDHEREHD